MPWFLMTLLCVCGWGCADLFYKIGSQETDRYSHLKIAVWVGLVMGVCSMALLPLSESGLSPVSLWSNAVRYSPASLSYIVSMVIGYAGLRYLDLSVASPIQNASGAFSALAMIVWFLLRGNGGAILRQITLPNIIGTGLIVIGMMGLAIMQQRLSRREDVLLPEERHYRFGVAALLFPILYCLFDTVGTAADGILLNESSGMGMGEIDVLILYGLTFFAVGLGCWLFLWIRIGKPYVPFARREWPKGVAALCEEAGQIGYIYAMAAKPIVAAPAVASYCIVSVLLSHSIMKERLKPAQIVWVITVIAGIVLMGIAEGIAEVS